jgi:hypothetical protein
MNRTNSAAALVAAAALLSSAPALAASYVGTVMATGLDNPRGLAFGPDGALYVAEAGIVQASGPGTPLRGTTAYASNTGAITRIEGGSQSRILTGLPSISLPSLGETTGPADIAFNADGTGYVLLGLGANPAVRATDLAPIGNDLGKVWQFTGSPTVFADVSQAEADRNPDGAAIDSNPFKMVAIGNELLVTDAGANSLLKVAADGTVSVLASFPARFIGPPAPFSQSVSTGLAVGPDGNYYVSELTGFPFTPGAARIYQVTPGGEVSVFAEGFTMITDIAFGTNGDLFVLQFDDNGLLAPGGTGTITLVRPNWRKTLYSGLVAPTGLEIGPDGALYVANFSAAEGAGQVLRIAAVPEPASWAMLILGFGLVGLAARRRQARPA